MQDKVCNKCPTQGHERRTKRNEFGVVLRDCPTLASVGRLELREMGHVLRCWTACATGAGAHASKQADGRGRERTGEGMHFSEPTRRKNMRATATATANRATLALRVKSSREFNNAQPSLIARGGAGVRTRVARLYVY